MFEQYAEILQQKFPDISIHGDLYPPSDFMMLLAKFLGFGKMLLMICIIASINIFTYIGVQPMPSWYNWCISNKFYACMMIFFLCNALEGQVVSTGAFEIYYNGVPVWSKLDTGRIPQPHELFRILETQI